MLLNSGFKVNVNSNIDGYLESLSETLIRSGLSIRNKNILTFTRTVNVAVKLPSKVNCILGYLINLYIIYKLD